VLRSLAFRLPLHYKVWKMDHTATAHRVLSVICLSIAPSRPCLHLVHKVLRVCCTAMRLRQAVNAMHARVQSQSPHWPLPLATGLAATATSH
jgi:hypothetical protein